MSVEQFTVQPSISLGTIALVVLVVTGAVLLLLAFTTGRRAKTIRRTFVVLMIIGILVIGLGVFLFFASNTPSTITVGSGYVSVQSPSFSGAGNLNITANKIASAYVGQIGSGNLTLSKQHGTNYDHFNVGIFTLGNGNTAYVVSNNSTDLIIQLNSGEYVLLGTSNTNALATSFSQSVYPLNLS
ncbi:MAG: hypothetical protein ABSC20_08295 [Candidatus Bathyarchaeia archaeon]|jgi:hypothetical protein